MTDKRPVKIAIAGGGTGGHVEPVMAVITVLRKKTAVDLLWLGASDSREEEAARKFGVTFVPIKVGKLRRYASWENLKDLFWVTVGIGQAWLALRRFRAQAVFSKSGYVALPTVIAARWLRIPVVAHESDAILGLSNRLSFKSLTKLCTGFPKALYSAKMMSKIEYSGNPTVWSEVVSDNLATSWAKFGFDPTLPAIIVLGGSQGATAINEHIWEILPGLIDHLQIIHQTGARQLKIGVEAKKSLTKKQQSHYFCLDFLDRQTLSDAFKIVKLAVTRSGANTLADLSYFALPAILIPLPSAAQNHQAINAQFVADSGGAVILPQMGLTGNVLKNLLDKLLSEPEVLKKMSEQMAKINPSDAAEKIATIILEKTK